MVAFQISCAYGTIPQSASLTAPFTQGSLWLGANPQAFKTRVATFRMFHVKHLVFLHPILQFSL